MRNEWIFARYLLLSRTPMLMDRIPDGLLEHLRVEEEEEAYQPRRRTEREVRPRVMRWAAFFLARIHQYRVHPECVWELIQYAGRNVGVGPWRTECTGSKHRSRWNLGKYEVFDVEYFDRREQAFQPNPELLERLVAHYTKVEAEKEYFRKLFREHCAELEPDERPHPWLQGLGALRSPDEDTKALAAERIYRDADGRMILPLHLFYASLHTGGRSVIWTKKRRFATKRSSAVSGLIQPLSTRPLLLFDPLRHGQEPPWRPMISRINIRRRRPRSRRRAANEAA